MNMDLPITGDGVIIDRNNFNKQPGRVTLNRPATHMINKVSDLKKAELTGENYTISDEQVVKAIERAIQAMQGKTTSLEFSVHEKTKTISVKILDSSTGEVIKEIPPEKTLDFVAKMWEMAGLFVDEKR